MKQEIIDGNKLIAEFMQLKIHDTLSIAKTPIKAYEWECNLFSEVELHYDSSWAWLMQVVEKIESENNYVQINGTECHIDSNDGQYSETNCCTVNNKFEADNDEETKIKSVWITVVQFIKWYNENKKSA